MKKGYLLALTAVLGICTMAQAQANGSQPWYVGALYNTQSFNDHDFETVGVIGGYKISDYLSLESQLSTGVSGYRGAMMFVDYKYQEDIQWQAALLAKVSYPVTDVFYVYGLAGASKSVFKIKTSTSSYKDSVFIGSEPYNLKHTSDGFTYGVGASYQVIPQLSVFAQYQVLPDFSSYSSTSSKNMSLGFNYQF